MTMSKTIKQLADELCVSKQAVFKKIKSEPLSTSLQQFVSTVNGTVYISVDGEELIKQTFSQNERQQVTINQSSTIDSKLMAALTDTIQVLKQQLELLNTQLQEKDRQIEQLQKLLDQQQQLHLVEQTKLLPILEEKQSLWGKIFRINNKRDPQ